MVNGRLLKPVVANDVKLRVIESMNLIDVIYSEPLSWLFGDRLFELVGRQQPFYGSYTLLRTFALGLFLVVRYDFTKCFCR